MAQTVPSRIPATLQAGDTLTWQVSLTDYPASAGWTLKYRLINAAGKIDISSSASGDDHLISVSAATSATYTPGAYSVTAYVENVGATQRYTIESGMSATVAPNLAASSATTYDTRSSAAKALAAVNTWLETKSLAVAEYEILGRRMKYIPIAELLALRSKLQAEVGREDAAARAAAGLPSKSRLYVRF